MWRSEFETGPRGSDDVGAAQAADDRAAGQLARCELERGTEERHLRLREMRRASGELLGHAMTMGGHEEMSDDYPGAASASAAGARTAHPGDAADNYAGPAAPADRPIAAAPAGPAAEPSPRRVINGGGNHIHNSDDAVADIESGDQTRSSLTTSPKKGASSAIDGGDDGIGKGSWGHLLDAIPPNRQLTLVFRDIQGFVPANFAAPSAGQKLAGRVRHPKHGLQVAERQILFDLAGCVRPGEVLALMGPSGSGKTTLLSVIGGRPAKALRVAGALTVNGQPYTKATRRRIGFVLQDDVLYEDLTVLETLRYAAYLRLPRTMAREEKEKRVEAVIDVLGVRKSRDTIIGGFLRRGISGGERKRVSIGNELLINPAIMMLDEPTSGLDSTSALHLINLLQDLAADGRAIVSTIHQPSSRLYGKLDSLMLLAEGHLMYSGPAQDVVGWFERFGHRVPFGTSIADFVLDVAMGEAGTTHSGNSGDAAVRELWEAWGANAAPKPARTNDSPAVAGGARAALPPPPSGEVGAVGDADGYDSHERKHRREGAPYWEQVKVLTSRAVKVRRFEQLTGSHFFQLLFVAAIAGLVWWQRGSTYTLLNGQDVLGLLFFELLFPSFRSLFHALFTFPNEYRMLMKERPAGLYKLSAYYIARTVADVPIELLNTVLFVLVVYWFGGLNRNAGDFFANLFTLMLCVMVAEAWGLLLGGIFMQPKKAQTATTVIMLTFLLVGGYYARSIPVWISWLRYLSFLYWGFNITTKIQFRRYQYYDCGGQVTSSSTTGYFPDDLAQIPACKPLADVQGTLGLPASPSDPAWPDALILIGMLIALRLAIYYVLRAKTRTRKTLMA